MTFTLLSLKFKLGTFAVVSIMVGKCVNKYANVPVALISQHLTLNHGVENGNLTAERLIQQPPDVMYSPVEVATLVCFIVGVIQVREYNIITTERNLKKSELRVHK